MSDQYEVDRMWEDKKKETAFPEFYYDSVEDKDASDKAGHPVYRSVEMVLVHQPGDRLNIPNLPVTDRLRERFARHYEAFKKEEEMPEVDGTPLEMWPGINPAQKKTLKIMECHSVDQLAEIPDNILQDCGIGMVALRAKARNWIEIRDGSSSVVSMKNRLQKLEERSIEQDEKIAELRDENEALSKNQKRSPGRPPKVG